MDKIDITPTWEEALRVYLMLLENGDPQGKKTAKSELQNMARIADFYSALVKKGEDDLFIKKDLLVSYMKKDEEG